MSEIVNCPSCGSRLCNVPRRPHAICPKCANAALYPRITAQDVRDSLPKATKLRFAPACWMIAGLPGIYRFTWSTGKTKARYLGRLGNFVRDDYCRELEAEILRVAEELKKGTEDG